MPPPPRSDGRGGRAGFFASSSGLRRCRERPLHDLAVPEMVRLVCRVFPSLLFVIPHLRAQFLGVLFELSAVIGVEVERAGVVRVDAELERQIGLEERHVAAVARKDPQRERL